MTVISGLTKHLINIVKEKEQTGHQSGKNWLSTEASKPENTNIPGTYRFVYLEREFFPHCTVKPVYTELYYDQDFCLE